MWLELLQPDLRTARKVLAFDCPTTLGRDVLGLTSEKRLSRKQCRLTATAGGAQIEVLGQNASFLLTAANGPDAPAQRLTKGDSAVLHAAEPAAARCDILYLLRADDQLCFPIRLVAEADADRTESEDDDVVLVEASGETRRPLAPAAPPAAAAAAPGLLPSTSAEAQPPLADGSALPSAAAQDGAWIAPSAVVAEAASSSTVGHAAAESLDAALLWHVRRNGRFEPYEADVQQTLDEAHARGESNATVVVDGTAHLVLFRAAEPWPLRQAQLSDPDRHWRPMKRMAPRKLPETASTAGGVPRVGASAAAAVPPASAAAAAAAVMAAATIPPASAAAAVPTASAAAAVPTASAAAAAAAAAAVTAAATTPPDSAAAAAAVPTASAAAAATAAGAAAAPSVDVGGRRTADATVAEGPAEGPAARSDGGGPWRDVSVTSGRVGSGQASDGRSATTEKGARVAHATDGHVAAPAETVAIASAAARSTQAEEELAVIRSLHAARHARALAASATTTAPPAPRTATAQPTPAASGVVVAADAIAFDGGHASQAEPRMLQLLSYNIWFSSEHQAARMAEVARMCVARFRSQHVWMVALDSRPPSRSSPYLCPLPLPPTSAPALP